MTAKNDIEISKRNISRQQKLATRFRTKAENKLGYSIPPIFIGGIALGNVWEGSVSKRIISGVIGTTAVFVSLRLHTKSLDDMDTRANKIAEIAVEEYKISQLDEVKQPEDLLFDQDNPTGNNLLATFPETT